MCWLDVVSNQKKNGGKEDANLLPTRQTIASRSHVTTGVAARYAGISKNHVKHLVSTGDLSSYVTPGGHHRVTSASLLNFVDGIDPSELVEDATEGKGIVIYARVSSSNQKQAGSLDRQVDRRSRIEQPLFCKNV